MAKTKTKSKNISLRKKWTAIIAVFVILLITFLALKPSYVKAPTQTTNNSSSNTSDWKTFTSKYGYSFMYPPNLVAKDVFSDTDVTSYYTEINNKDELNKLYGSALYSNKDYFNMYIIYNPDEEKDLQTIRNLYSTATDITDLTVGNEPGFKIKIDGGPKIRYLYIITVHDKKEYRLELTTLDSEYSSYYDQILSTFKFTQ